MTIDEPGLLQGAQYELRFQSLFVEGRGYAFPCDAEGHVDLDRLSDRARHSYYFARTTVGRDVSMPVVCLLRCAATSAGLASGRRLS
jgi:hypothetical protein